MWTLPKILTVLILALSFDSISFERNRCLTIEETRVCKTKLDSLTKKTIYVEVDKEAENEGGQSALMRQYFKIGLDSIPDDLDTRFIIAFIVDIDGQIMGERIIKDKTGSVGQQMLKIAKSFRWEPAICNGRKVPTLKELRLQMCLGQD